MAEQPDWQPISRLPLIGSMIDGMFQDAEEHYQTLLQASPKPHVLDDYTSRTLLLSKPSEVASHAPWRLGRSTPPIP
jgi:hypothetical protein